MIGNINQDIGRVRFSEGPTVTHPIASIVSAALVPVVLLVSCSVVLIATIVVVFRRKYKAKENEQQKLADKMNQLTSISTPNSPGKFGQ